MKKHIGSPELGAWDAPDASIRFEYVRDVLEEIHASVQASFKKIAHGGLENGGVLYGERDGATVRILDWRPIQCEYAYGPTFLLSQRDYAQLETQVRTPDPSLNGLTPVGWFASHSRNGMRLRDSDVDLHHKLFSAPIGILLLMNPSPDGLVEAIAFLSENGTLSRTAAGDFVKESQSVDQQPSLCEALAMKPAAAVSVTHSRRALLPEPSRRRQGLAERPKAREEGLPARGGVDPELVPAEEPVWAADPDLYTDPGFGGSEERIGGRARRTLILWGFIVLFAATAFLAMPRLSSSDPAPAARLAIDELDNGVPGQLQIRWAFDPSALQAADLASLEVMDGDASRHIDLQVDEFLHGTLTYIRHSGDVQARLQITRHGKPPIREYARFLGQPIAEPVEDIAVSTQAMTTDAHDEELRQAFEREQNQTRKIEESIRQIEERLKQEEMLAGGTP